LISRVQRELEKAFRDAMARLSAAGASFGAWEPPADVIDRGEDIVVLVDTPGFSKEDIKVKVTESAVEVMAQRSRTVQPEGKYLLRQRMGESLYKRIDLPVKVRPEHAKARLENGVLEIVIPKSEVAREIQVIVE